LTFSWTRYAIAASIVAVAATVTPSRPAAQQRSVFRSNLNVRS